jgi:hypothetical protein
MKAVNKGDVVKYGDGHYRVSAKFKNFVNLCGVFSGHIHHKKVPISQVVEDHDAWYQEWTQSETYRCM